MATVLSRALKLPGKESAAGRPRRREGLAWGEGPARRGRRGGDLAVSREGCGARGTGRGARVWVGDRGRSGTLGDSRGLPGQRLLEARGAGSEAEGRDGDCQVPARVAAVSRGGPATGASFPEHRDSLLLSGVGPEGKPGAAGL